ncbi:RNA-binding S4 domain-containing protein [Novosphingobium sp. 1949]|uniref:RNA-binding S4 domain-containing protein n=1 Tax=Novosphingobium organovorum TaxID=2930092 RepID=A0ABT0BAV6_9SPHN|nr:RNA-binding S4 domain-containing protein [Novosphingobium organovorum]MCJ2182186.1 RNA-binding S4 domain-containing protein [Novosphingobium organovorum]
MRIDKLLWFLRLAKTRTVAQGLAQEGHMRLNGRRIERAHQKVAPGDVLTVPIGAHVRVIEILALPTRRGPASEAQACYRVLDASPSHPVAAPLQH